MLELWSEAMATGGGTTAATAKRSIFGVHFQIPTKTPAIDASREAYVLAGFWELKNQVRNCSPPGYMEQAPSRGT